MTEIQLQTQIENLRSRIAQHQVEIANQERRQAALRTAPTIPAGASAPQIAKIFEGVAGRDDEIAGVEAAVRELEERTARLQAQLSVSTRELQQYQTQAHRSRIRQDVLNAIAK